VTAYPRLSDSRIVVTGIIEVDTEPGVVEDVAQALAAEHVVANVKITAGGRDLVAAVQTRDLDELAHIATRLFQRTAGVRATRTHVSTGVPGRGKPLATSQPGRGTVRTHRGEPLVGCPARSGDGDHDGLGCSGRADSGNCSAPTAGCRYALWRPPPASASPRCAADSSRCWPRG